MAARTLLDTDVYSEMMRDKNDVVRTRARSYLTHHERLTISAITVVEVVKGLHKMRRDEAIERFVGNLSTVELLALDQEAAVIGGKIYGELERLGQPIGRADPMIAGIAIARGLVLATGNTDHYERIRAAGYPLVLDNWRLPEGSAGP